MEKVDDDTAYYRQRTVARLIDKRRQIESLEHKEAEQRKAEDMKFRVQWKEGFKRKRSELISSKVDKRILHRIMREYPGIAQAVNAEKLGIAESKGDDVLADLADDFDEREIGAENPLMSPNIKVPGRGSRPSPVVQFLQNAATFRLSVNNRLKEQHAAQLRSPTGAPDWRGHAADGPTDTAELKSTMRRTSSATDSDFGADDRGKVNSARGQDSSRLFSSYRSEMQVSKLVLSLLQDTSNSGAPHADATLHVVNPNTDGKEGSIVDQFSNRPIKATGLMSKLFRDCTLHRERSNLVTSPTAHGTSFTLHRSSVTPGGGRTPASGSKRGGGGGDTVSGASGGGSGGSVGSDEMSSNRAAAAGAVPEPATSSNAMFCSLVEGVFLMGPSAHSIQEQIELRRDERTAPGTGASDAGLPTVPDFNAVVSPTVLFCTERGYSAEIFSLLPMYCFPSDVEMAVRSAKTATPSNGPSKRRKNSLNLLTSKTVSDPAQEGLKAAKKRNAVFFNSDFALGLSAAKEAAAGGKADTAAVAAAADQSALPAVNMGMMHRNPFVVLIGDHTSFEYGVCIQLPMTFKMDGGLTVTTSYVLCLMTKLPFFSLLFHVLDQFDAYFDGFKFRDPIPVQDLSFPYMPELRPLSDLGAKLKRLLVPKYPYIISTALNNMASTRRRASTELSALGFANGTAATPVSGTVGQAGTTGGGGGMLTAEYPTLDNEQDVKAILPDVEFGYGAITSSRKVNAMFKRSVYQSYFSAAGTKFDSNNRALMELISRYDKMVADFVPNSVHRSEKDKEDTYLIMLWALPVLLKHLPLDQVVLALGCAISEMRIIVKHPDLHVVSAVILALLQLLRPLRWCAPVVVTMPDALDTMLESPTFVMIGLQKLPAHFTLLEGFVVIDPLERIVHLNPIDVVESHTILLPHGSKLVNALSTSAETILRCTKKKRNTRYRRSIPHGELDAAEAASGAAAAGQTGGATAPPAALPQPVELDVASYENLQLLAAVKTFTGLVSNHIQAILNTAIQMQQQTKQASREERRLLIRTTSALKLQKPTKPTPVAPGAPSLPPHPVHVPDSATAPVAPAAPQPVPVLHLAAPSLPLPSEGQSAAPVTVQAAAEPVLNPLTVQNDVHQQSGALQIPTESPQRGTKTNSSNSDAKRRRQTDFGPALHSPGASGEGHHLRPLHNKSPAGRHSLPPSKKSPHHLGLHGSSPEQSEHREKGRDKASPLRQPDFKPAKAKDFAERMKQNQKPTKAAHTAHTAHAALGGHAGHGTAHHPAGRHSMGGAGVGKHGKDGAHHAPKPAGKVKAHHPGGTESSANPHMQSLEGTVAVNTSIPAAEVGSGEEGKSQQVTAPEEAERAAQRIPPSLQASGRLMSGNALVFSIDALMSPSPVNLPSPKAEGIAESFPEEAVPPIVPTAVRAVIAGDETTTRDSLNDETCSEITVTDAGGLHVGDDGSGGQRVRTESSHDSGDRAGSEVAAESIASSSSSLPSLRSNAPLLLVKEIGQSGTKFIRRIHETQMYSDYCQLLRQQSALAAAKRVAAEKALQEGAARLLAATSSDQLDELGLACLSSPNVKAWSHMSLAAEVESAQLAGQGGDGDTDTELELDALHEVFSILLSGTTPMADEAREALTANFAQRSTITLEELQAKLELAAPPLEGGMDAAKAAFEAAVRKYTKLTNCTHSPGEEEPARGTALWCSGLRCGGLCNTPYCNSVCLALWVEKVRALRRQAAFRSILTKKNTSSATLLSSARRLRHQLDDGAADPQGSSEKGAPVGGRTATEKVITALLVADKAVEVVRHHKETQSQYEQRKSIVESKKLDLLRAARPATAVRGGQSQPKHQQKSVYGPSNVDGKKHLYARGSSADPATLAIARYYAERQRKYRRHQVRRALQVLTPLMLRFVCLYRKYKFFNAIYLIQALIRGFYVRNHIPELVEALIARRIRRLLAVIRIRRYLRQHADQIYRRYLRAKMEMQRRRRATISIPVRVSGTMSEKVTSSRQPQRVPRKVYSISDDILPSTGINIPGLSGSGASAIGSAKDSVGGASSLAGSGATGSDRATQLPAADASTAVAATDSPAAQQAAEEQAGSSGGNVVAGGETASGKGAAPKPPSRFSTGAYTERVKEYLQFGKVLHRSASTSIEPNKYAAHHLQRRNSRPGPGAGAVPGPPGGSPPKAMPASAIPVPAPAPDGGSAASVLPTDSQAGDAVPAIPDAAPHPAVDDEVTGPTVASSDDTGTLGKPSSGAEASPLFKVQDDSPAGGEGPGSGSSSTLSPDFEESALSPQSRGRLKVDLQITTRFSSDDSENSSNSATLRAEAVHSTPIGGTVPAAQAAVSEDVVAASDADVDAVALTDNKSAGANEGAAERVTIPLAEPSPTAGIPMVHGTYEDSDDENTPREGAADASRKTRAGSLTYSERGSEDPGSPLSLLDMSVVHGTLRSAHHSSSGDMATGDTRATRPPTARTAPSTLTADEDDRASVLSSNSNSTTPARRSSTAGSTTDFETAQPVLLSILGHHNVVRTSSASTLGVASDSADRPHREHDAVSSVVGDDVTVVSSVSQSSVRTGRSTLRNSLPPNFQQDASNFKKMSPIGRYAAEKSYDMARIFHPRHGGVGTSRVPFQASGSVDGDGEKGAVLSPLQQHRATDSLPSQPPRQGRLGVLGESSRQMRRQTFFVPGSSHSFSRRLGSQDLESIAESLSASSSAVKPASGRGGTRSERLSEWESSDSIGGPLEGLPSEEQHYNWMGGEARRRATLHSALPSDSPTHRGSPSHQRTPSSSSLEETLRVKEAGKSLAEDWVPRSEHLQYHLHSKSGSPKAQGSKKSHADSPTRGLFEAENEGRSAKAGEQSAVDPGSRASEYSRSDHRGRALTTDTLGGDGEDVEEDDDELEFSAVDDLLVAVKHPPLRTLGCNVMDYVNRQQIRSLQEMYRQLREGVEILKHGRRGAPKFKTLFCDTNMTKLYWRAQGSRPDGSLDNLAEDASYYPTLLDPSATAASLALGVDVTAPAPSAGGTRLHFGGKSNADRVLYIRDIKEVREDCESEVMQRSVAKGYVTRGCTSTVSIVWEDRTLDFEIEEDAWKVLFHALQILVNFYQVLVAAPRATFSSGRPPEGFFNFLTYDTAGHTAASSNSLSTSTSTAAVAAAAPTEGRSAPKRRMSSGFGSMLLSRRSSKLLADSDGNTHTA